MNKQIWWDHFLESKKFWHYGITLKRLEKAKDVIFRDRWTWEDALFRHSGNKMNPHTMQE